MSIQRWIEGILQTHSHLSGYVWLYGAQIYYIIYIKNQLIKHEDVEVK